MTAEILIGTHVCYHPNWGVSEELVHMLSVFENTFHPKWATSIIIYYLSLLSACAHGPVLILVLMSLPMTLTICPSKQIFRVVLDAVRSIRVPYALYQSTSIYHVRSIVACHILELLLCHCFSVGSKTRSKQRATWYWQRDRLYMHSNSLAKKMHVKSNYGLRVLKVVLFKTQHTRLLLL